MTANSSSSSGAGLLEDRVRDRELADVVQQPADREVAQARRPRGRAPRRPAPRAARRGACAARCRRPSRRGGASARARCEPRKASSAATSSAPCRSPASGRDCDGAAEVERDRDADEERCPRARARGRATSRAGGRSCSQRGARARPPARRCRRRRRGRRCRRVRMNVRTARRARSPKKARPSERGPIAGGLPGSRHRGHERRRARGPRAPSAMHGDQSDGLEHEQRLGRRAGGAGPAARDSARIAPPTGSVAAPVSATTPFVPTMKPGVARPWSASSAAIDREGRADEHGARIPPARSGDGQRNACRRRHEGREHDAPEVRRAGEHHLVAADEMDQCGWQRRAGAGSYQCGDERVTPHEGRYRLVPRIA